eukprot:3942011-Rhodomonas_salina.1
MPITGRLTNAGQHTAARHLSANCTSNHWVWSCVCFRFWSFLCAESSLQKPNQKSNGHTLLLSGARRNGGSEDGSVHPEPDIIMIMLNPNLFQPVHVVIPRSKIVPTQPRPPAVGKSSRTGGGAAEGGGERGAQLGWVGFEPEFTDDAERESERLKARAEQAQVQVGLGPQVPGSTTESGLALGGSTTEEGGGQAGLLLVGLGGESDPEGTKEQVLAARQVRRPEIKHKKPHSCTKLL